MRELLQAIRDLLRRETTRQRSASASSTLWKRIKAHRIRATTPPTPAPAGAQKAARESKALKSVGATFSVGFAAAVLAASCLLIAAGWLGLSRNLFDNGPARPFHSRESILTPLTYVPENPGSTGLYTNPLGVEIAIVVDQLNSDKRTATVTIYAAIGFDVLRDMREFGTDQPLVAPVPCSGCTTPGYGLKPAYAQAPVQIHLSGRDPVFDMSIPTTLGALASAHVPTGLFTLPDPLSASPTEGSGAPATVDLPVTWYSNTYPDDAFFLSVAIEVVFPPYVSSATCKGPTCTVLFPPYAPEVAVALKDSDSAAGMTATLDQAADLDAQAYLKQFVPGATFVQLTPSGSHAAPPPAGRQFAAPFEVYFSRSQDTQLYITIIALAPFLMCLLLFHHIVLQAGRRRAVRLPLKDAPVSLLTLAGAMLMILPIRAVLVPSDVPGPTRVDFLLGMELLILMALGSLQHFVLMAQRTRDGAQSEEDAMQAR